MPKVGACLAVAAVLAVTAVPVSARAATRLPGFQSPSGNIRCLVVSGGPSVLHCEIGHAAYAAALQRRCTARASLDWHGFELGATSKGAITCSGGILYPPARRPRYLVLPYGTRWPRAPFACWSRRSGVSCENRGGHGLFISAQSWRAW